MEKTKKDKSEHKALAVSTFAENLLKPVEFASKDDFQKIDTVKGLGKTAERIVREMGGAADFERWDGEVKMLGGLFSGYDSAPREKRRSILEEARGILLKIVSGDSEADLSGAEERLKTPVTFVKGVGPKRAKVFEKKGVSTVEDLLYYFPRYYINIRGVKKIRELKLKERAALVVEVVVAGEKFTSKRRYKRINEVIVTDGTDLMTLVWFNAPYVKGRYKVGMRLLVTGIVSEFNNRKSMAHPDVEPWEEEADQLGSDIIGRYQLPERMRLMTVVKIVAEAVDKYSDCLIDGVPEDVRVRNRLIPLKEAVRIIHNPALPPEGPKDTPDIEDGSWLPIRSVAMDELFIMELGLLLKRRKIIRSPGRSFNASGRLMEGFMENLPFSLTSAQRKALDEITEDIRSPRTTHRLLQGDVGSGKTVVALLAALNAVEEGAQAAFMAPTEILSEQHFKNLEGRLAKIGVKSALLTSSVKGAEREAVLDGIKSGELKIVFGTHALIQEGVEFSDLGFIVVDEQHRFGVMQRGALKEKGKKPEVLVMTATPIPRTLALTVYGDLDISVIDELPPGRKPVKTLLFGEDQRKSAYEVILGELKKGRQAFVVYPLVTESETLNLKNATEMAENLSSVFSDFTVRLITGRMKGGEKEEVMDRFVKGEVDILVATTVIEVGVDVPNATVMVVEHAERFGLSQLHQLRGRVGRGGDESFCILISDYRVTDDAKRRLEVMLKTTDGFIIAEEDLKIRGPGEFMGTRQSGIPAFRAADLIRDYDTLLTARAEAEALIEKDPLLSDPAHHETRRVLLSRFEGRLSLMDIG
ncbi:MAG: ATP-dependent DNA helicase RecG [Deltaproteobacteria bacterium]|uniref:ATP-dependent DNA helicase RecG n=1 Tax=Candidatus Zymogenus saltonus TaxID=2844893 RepID=A0A9D8KGA6_9DELT|nr:ATP-dependent DNA helicase RecG [Candidatus Zymogenus saltonus]